MSLTRSTALAAGLGAIVSLGVVAQPAMASTNLLVNGNFSSPSTNSYATTVTGWTDNGGQYGVVTNAYLNGGSSPLGGQSLFLNDLQAYQVLSASDFTVGQTYTLTGGVIQNDSNLSYTTPATTSVFEIVATNSTSSHTTLSSPGPQTMGSVLLTHASATALSSSAYTYVTPLTFTYEAGDGPIDVVLLNPGHRAGTSMSGQVQSDFGNLSLSAAPEPSQVGMLALVGLGLGGLMLRARRKSMVLA